MNGKSVEIDNTDAEGRLILSGMFLHFSDVNDEAAHASSDALYYTSTTFKPHTLLDVATLTGYGTSCFWALIFLIVLLKCDANSSRRSVYRRILGGDPLNILNSRYA